jgi:hypothetical protein
MFHGGSQWKEVEKKKFGRLFTKKKKVLDWQGCIHGHKKYDTCENGELI